MPCPIHVFRQGCDFVHDGIHAVVGPGFSSTSLKLSPLLGAMHVPFISYAATSPTLGDPTAHPFFSRVVPQDTAQAAVIVKAVCTTFPPLFPLSFF